MNKQIRHVGAGAYTALLAFLVLMAQVVFVPSVQAVAETSVSVTTPTACNALTNRVVSFNQGPSRKGPVLAERSDPSKALGAPQKNDTLNFVSLGFGGQLTLAYDGGAVFNGPGDDIILWETSYGDKNRAWSAYPEAVIFEASQDGTTWVEIGRTSAKDQAYDLGSLPWARFFRMTDITDLSKFANNKTSDGFDVDGLEALHCATVVIIAQCPPGTAAYATSVVDTVQGPAKTGASVLPERSDKNKALGAPQNNDTLNFYSLGFGGWAHLAFEPNLILNGPGDDVRIWETSYGDKSRPWSAYPEAVIVEATQDGTTWVEIGRTSDKDQSFDLGSLAYAIGIRLTDITNPAPFPNRRDVDGFDIDAVQVLNCGRIVEDPQPTPAPTTPAPTTPAPTTPAPTEEPTVEPTTPAPTEEPTVQPTTPAPTPTPNACPMIDPKAHLRASIKPGSIPNTWIATFTNNSDCLYEVGFAAYHKYDEVLKNQTLFDSTSAVIGRGRHTLMVTSPGCAIQLDAVFDASHNWHAAAGNPPIGIAPNPSYNKWIGKEAALDMVPLILPSFYSGLYGPYGERYSVAERLLAASHPKGLAYCTVEPTPEPTTPAPTEEPTVEPTTPAPTEEPTVEPTEEPTAEPTAEPTVIVTEEPTAEPTEEPTAEPTAEPTVIVTEEPTAEPTEEPTAEPTAEPTVIVTEEPTAEPTEEPTAEPTAEPTVIVTEEPTAEPTPSATPNPLCPMYDPKFHLRATIRAGSSPTEWIARITNVSDCLYDVAFASYTKTDEILKNQVLYDYVILEQLGRGRHDFIIVTSPACAIQLDVMFDASHNWQAAAGDPSRGIAPNAAYNKWLGKEAELDAIPLVLPTFHSGLYGYYGERYSYAERLLNSFHPPGLPYCNVVVTPAPTTPAPTTPAPTEEPTVIVTTPAPTTPALTEEPTVEPTTPAPTEEPTVEPTTPAPTEEPTTPAPTDDPWDKSSVKVEGQCLNGVATFFVTNTGDTGEGDMRGPVEYRLFVNGGLLLSGTLQLLGGETSTLEFPFSGTIRLEVDQRPGHPGNSQPNAQFDCSPNVTPAPTTPAPTEAPTTPAPTTPAPTTPAPTEAPTTPAPTTPAPTEAPTTPAPTTPAPTEAPTTPAPTTPAPTTPAPTTPAPTQVPWDKSSVKVEAVGCIDGIATFKVTNGGKPNEGDMQGPVEYRLLVNGILVLKVSDQLILKGGEERIFTFGGYTGKIRLEVDQRPGHPGNSRPNAEVTCETVSDGDVGTPIPTPDYDS